MPKTLRTDDPHLLTAVHRLARVHLVWGWLLIALAVLTQWEAGLPHPVAGLPFLVIGVACLRWGEPALLAAVSTLFAFSIVPTINGRVTVLGPEPIVALLDMSTIEIAALVIGKILVVLTAANQFLFYRLLYGTARASSDQANLPVIPPMVLNRTNGLARWARWLGVIAVVFAATSVLLRGTAPLAYQTRLVGEVGGSLAVLAVGLGLGAAFAPTDERRAALWGAGLGVLSYFAAATVIAGIP